MSVSQQGVEITNRFFLAVDTLISNGKLRSLRQFTIMYGLNYGNINTQKNHPERYIMKPELIARLCLDFGISAEWVLLGIGDMFTRRVRKAPQKPFDTDK